MRPQQVLRSRHFQPTEPTDQPQPTNQPTNNQPIWCSLNERPPPYSTASGNRQIHAPQYSSTASRRPMRKAHARCTRANHKQTTNSAGTHTQRGNTGKTKKKTNNKQRKKRKPASQAVPQTTVCIVGWSVWVGWLVGWCSWLLVVQRFVETLDRVVLVGWLRLLRHILLTMTSCQTVCSQYSF